MIEQPERSDIWISFWEQLQWSFYKFGKCWHKSRLRHKATNVV